MLEWKDHGLWIRKVWASSFTSCLHLIKLYKHYWFSHFLLFNVIINIYLLGLLGICENSYKEGLVQCSKMPPELTKPEWPVCSGTGTSSRTCAHSSGYLYHILKRVLMSQKFPPNKWIVFFCLQCPPSSQTETQYELQIPKSILKVLSTAN